MKYSLLAAQVFLRVLSIWVHIQLYMLYQYFQRHVATAVRVWLVLVTCGRPLVGHSDWINSHQKHAVDWVLCSCTHPHTRPRMSNIAGGQHENCSYSLLGPGFGLAWNSMASHGEGLWCHTPAEWWMEDRPTWKPVLKSNDMDSLYSGTILWRLYDQILLSYKSDLYTAAP